MTIILERIKQEINHVNLLKNWSRFVNWAFAVKLEDKWVFVNTESQKILQSLKRRF